MSVPITVFGWFVILQFVNHSELSFEFCIALVVFSYNINHVDLSCSFPETSNDISFHPDANNGRYWRSNYSQQYNKVQFQECWLFWFSPQRWLFFTHQNITAKFYICIGFQISKNLKSKDVVQGTDCDLPAFTLPSFPSTPHLSQTDSHALFFKWTKNWWRISRLDEGATAEKSPGA